MDFGKQHTTNMAAVLAGKRPRQRYWPEEGGACLSMNEK